ncbi:DUF397 domain-containing protein [Streptomyces olivoreticuli]|uniref:DUF397 domain-containing protein n=1 Tax=Streptomyces olivoreticuli TaxID=68246 RepID=UPI0026580C58|nr:DUF397 domain-containing protein [Streptomyces olivoreticuli]WKK21874.1 DUF397 domain-containing protein [Streptomyces olivoreticuli]
MSTGIKWQKSSFSGAGGEQCVEIAAQADAILIRESDAPDVTARANRVGFAAFLAGVKTGRFGS